VTSAEEVSVSHAVMVVHRHLLLQVQTVTVKSALVEARRHCGHVLEVLSEHLADVALTPVGVELRLDLGSLALRKQLQRPNVPDA
jgi:hypothetical protein